LRRAREEQLSILIVLLKDAMPRFVSAADATLNRIPPSSLSALLARTDVPERYREFSSRRGVVAEAGPATDSDDPLVEAGRRFANRRGVARYNRRGNAGRRRRADRERLVQQIAKMTIPND